MSLVNVNENPVEEKSTNILDKYNNLELKSIDSSYLLGIKELDSNCELAQCNSIKRLNNTLSQYTSAVKRNETAENITFDNIFNDDYDHIQILNDFHHSLKTHSHHFEEIHNMFANQCNDTKCELNNCLMIMRNHRRRAELKDNAKVLKQLYFNCNSRDIINQQILDKIHDFYIHSFDIGHKIPLKDRNRLLNMTDISNTDQYDDCKDDSKINDKSLQSIHQYINQKRDSFARIITESKDSVDTSLKQKEYITNKFSTQIDAGKIIKYSFGFTYFYWSYFKNNDEFNDPMRYMNQFSPTAANDRYSLGEFYVEPKFKGLKDELINNPLYSISISQWNTLIGKAEIHLVTDRLKSVKCDGNLLMDTKRQESTKYYDIPHEAALAVNHIAAIMTYCNESILQRKFTETYRKIPDNESNEHLIERHRNFAHLGRLLRELVGCFPFVSEKEYSAFKNKTGLYHGISIQTMFGAIDAIIKGPTSTTRDYAVAAGFCANKGMILELQMDFYWAIHGHLCLFECSYISDYPNESEVFFIGGYSKFIFRSIINAAQG
eukprot:219560_1